MCCTRIAGNTKRKNDAKNRDLGTIAQLRNQGMYRQSEKNFVKQQYLFHMSS